MNVSIGRFAPAILVATLLCGCGGGSGDDTSSPADLPDTSATDVADDNSAPADTPPEAGADVAPADVPVDAAQADAVELYCTGLDPIEWWTESFSSVTWLAAQQACEALGEGWRLPDICEMRSAIVGCPATQAPGECGISYECDDFCSGDCTGCQLGAGPGTNGCYLPGDWPGPCGYYWTSTAHGSWAGKVWVISSERAFPFATDKTGKVNVRCVK